MAIKDFDSEFDDLDKHIKESTDLDPMFPEKLAAVGRRNDLYRELKVQRLERKMSQTVVAAAMGTSQSAVARMENVDGYAPNLATLEKYTRALGYRIEFKLTPIPETSEAKREGSRR